MAIYLSPEIARKHSVRSPAMIAKLRGLLWQVTNDAGSSFSGLGLIISDRPDDLPICSLRSRSVLSTQVDIVQTLVAISVSGSEYHDGFHIISSDWKLLRIAQYFSPPIISNAKIDRSKKFGGRYLAALFGSAIEHIQMTGIASRGFGVAVFEHGAERLFESAL